MISSLAFAAVGILSCAFVVYMNLEEPAIPRRGRWDGAPKVVVDPSLPYRYHKAVDLAVRSWRRRGHLVHDATTGTLPLDDAGLPPSGTIYIIPDGSGAMQPEHAGHTRWAVNNQLIVRALIRLDPSLPANNHLTWTAEHELGHALGYEHAKRSAHLMSPRGYSRDDRGLEGP